jgi:hypothetical protein
VEADVATEVATQADAIINASTRPATTKGNLHVPWLAGAFEPRRPATVHLAPPAPGCSHTGQERPEEGDHDRQRCSQPSGVPRAVVDAMLPASASSSPIVAC